MKKVITILLIILVLAAGVGFGVYHHKSNETKFNDDYINGNTAGNLYNAGIFCTAADLFCKPFRQQQTILNEQRRFRPYKDF